MRKRRLVILCVLLVAIGVGLGAQTVRDLDTSSYTGQELAQILAELATLEHLTSDTSRGSQRSLGAAGWSSYQFALFSAGRLEELGYSVLLAQGSGWSDGLHTWVLVGLSYSQGTAWIPLEATPRAGAQMTLGSIPFTTRGPSAAAFDSRYLAPQSTAQTPVNRPPSGSLRTTTPTIDPEDNAKFLVLGAADTGGEIVVYRWDFGDGSTSARLSTSELHRYDIEGTYVVTLWIIDNAGGSALATTTVQVVSSTPTGANRHEGCGCGGSG